MAASPASCSAPLRGPGLDPAKYAGAALSGAPERAIMRQGRWKSVAIARRYIRAGTLLEENAAAYCGL